MADVSLLELENGTGVLDLELGTNNALLLQSSAPIPTPTPETGGGTAGNAPDGSTLWKRLNLYWN